MNHMNAIRRFAILLFVPIFLLISWGPTKAQSSADVQYFAQTGHNVKGDFLRFFKAARDPVLVFGYPITEQMTSKDGKAVQYFQRARLELHPELPESQRIQMTALGKLMYQPGSQQLPVDNPAACQSFATGFRVCFAFLNFYQANGGLAQFGNPISPFEFHENLIVQYFEKARFEWRADRPEGQRVVITDLGRIYLDQLTEDQANLRPFQPVNATIDDILSIQARAFVQRAITTASGQQTIYVLVQSQTDQPVAGSNGKATVHFSDGHSEEYYFSTNNSGLGSLTFNFANQKQGDLVLIDIVVTYQGLSATTSTSFRIWL